MIRDQIRVLTFVGGATEVLHLDPLRWAPQPFLNSVKTHRPDHKDIVHLAGTPTYYHILLSGSCLLCWRPLTSSFCHVSGRVLVFGRPHLPTEMELLCQKALLWSACSGPGFLSRKGLCWSHGSHYSTPRTEMILHGAFKGLLIQSRFSQLVSHLGGLAGATLHFPQPSTKRRR